MNQNDLYIEYARVIKMCQGTDLEDKPWLCVKFNGTGLFDTHPRFDSDPELYNFDTHPRFDSDPELYKFAIAILEDRAVFVGDKIYAKTTKEIEYTVTEKWAVAYGYREYPHCEIDDKKFSWQLPKPKRMFTLNGVELPCPVDWMESSNGNVAVIDGEIFWFKNKMDADLVRDTLSKIFREARDKP